MDGRTIIAESMYGEEDDECGEPAQYGTWMRGLGSLLAALEE